PEDLDHHRLISYYHNKAGHRGDLDWHLRIGAKEPRVPYLTINSAIGLHEALVLGLGIVVVTQEFPHIQSQPKFDSSQASSSLINILPNVGVNIPVYFAAQHEKAKLNKVALLEKFLKKLKVTENR